MPQSQWEVMGDLEFAYTKPCAFRSRSRSTVTRVEGKAGRLVALSSKESKPSRGGGADIWADAGITFNSYQN